MKKMLCLLAFGLITIGLQAQEFKFEKEVINYGKIKKGTDGKRVFEFTNVGDAPIIIEEIKTGCDCAVPEKPTKPIMPGEKSTLTVEYDTSKAGGFSKTITIFSNAKTDVKKIRIKGYIQG